MSMTTTLWPIWVIAAILAVAFRHETAKAMIWLASMASNPRRHRSHGLFRYAPGASEIRDDLSSLNSLW